MPLLISLVFIAIIATITSAIKQSGYHVAYSATPSVPVGFYLIRPFEELKKQDMVEFTPPKDALEFAKEKGWVPKSGRIIKYVFAIPGDHVCIKEGSLYINGENICRVKKFYDDNKLLPQTNFCGKIEDGQYLLLSTKNERSYDGRYFGIIDKSKISGRATPIFTLE